MIYVGADPGVSGGIAVLSLRGGVLATHKMPDTIGDLIALFREIRSKAVDRFGSAAPVDGAPFVRLVVERVNAGVFRKAGKMGVVSAFTFGRSVGNLHTAITAAGIPFDEVMPVKWQTVMGCRTKGDKNISKRRAQQLFPNVTVIHAIADALLLAEYCRRVHRGIK